MATYTLRAPDARLRYQVTGSGPTLLLIPGGPADSTVYTAVQELLADHYTVVTYDPRGISLSQALRVPPKHEIIRVHADDVQRLLAECGTAPAYVFAQCGGALIAMDHLVRYSRQIQTLILHEPTIRDYVDPSIRTRADVSATYRMQGLTAALAKFSELFGVDLPMPPDNPGRYARELVDRLHGNLAYAFTHLFPAVIDFIPDLDALVPLKNRIVVGVGAKTAGQVPHESAVRLANDLGVSPISFPGDHMGFAHEPFEFAARLRDVFDRHQRLGIVAALA